MWRGVAILARQRGLWANTPSECRLWDRATRFNWECKTTAFGAELPMGERGIFDGSCPIPAIAELQGSRMKEDIRAGLQRAT
jgi:hypothetical protein